MHLSENLFRTEPEVSTFDGNKPKEKKTIPLELVRNSYTLNPKEFVIGKTQETIKVSEKYMGIFDGKSSLAQIGLFVHISSVLVDPGTNSTITAEIFNASDFTIEPKVGMKIGQIIFAEFE